MTTSDAIDLLLRILSDDSISADYENLSHLLPAAYGGMYG